MLDVVAAGTHACPSVRRAAGLCVAVCVCLGAGRVYGGAPGTVGGQYLWLEPSARIVGLGGAFAAVGGDPWSIGVNPAGISSCVRPAIAATQMNMLAGVRFVTLAYAHPAGAAGVLGAGAMYLFSDEDEYATTGDKVGEFRNAGVSLALAYARPLAGDCDAGLALKGAYVALGPGYRADVLVLDVGIRYRPLASFAAACAMSNLPLGLGFTGNRESVPTALRLGVALAPMGGALTVTADAYASVDGLPALLSGVEYRFLLSGGVSCVVRAGVRWRGDGAPFGQNAPVSAGAGVRRGRVAFDYSFSPYSLLRDNTHFFTLGMEL